MVFLLQVCFKDLGVFAAGLLQGPVVPGDGPPVGALARPAGARQHEHPRGVLGRGAQRRRLHPPAPALRPPAHHHHGGGEPVTRGGVATHGDGGTGGRDDTRHPLEAVVWIDGRAAGGVDGATDARQRTR